MIVYFKRETIQTIQRSPSQAHKERVLDELDPAFSPAVRDAILDEINARHYEMVREGPFLGRVRVSFVPPISPGDAVVETNDDSPPAPATRKKRATKSNPE